MSITLKKVVANSANFYPIDNSETVSFKRFQSHAEEVDYCFKAPPNVIQQTIPIRQSDAIGVLTALETCPSLKGKIGYFSGEKYEVISDIGDMTKGARELVLAGASKQLELVAQNKSLYKRDSNDCSLTQVNHAESLLRIGSQNPYTIWRTVFLPIPQVRPKVPDFVIKDEKTEAQKPQPNRLKSMNLCCFPFSWITEEEHQQFDQFILSLWIYNNLTAKGLFSIDKMMQVNEAITSSAHYPLESITENKTLQMGLKRAVDMFQASTPFKSLANNPMFKSHLADFLLSCAGEKMKVTDETIAVKLRTYSGGAPVMVSGMASIVGLNEAKLLNTPCKAFIESLIMRAAKAVIEFNDVVSLFKEENTEQGSRPYAPGKFDEWVETYLICFHKDVYTFYTAKAELAEKLDNLEKDEIIPKDTADDIKKYVLLIEGSLGIQVWSVFLTERYFEKAAFGVQSVEQLFANLTQYKAQTMDDVLVFGGSPRTSAEEVTFLKSHGLLVANLNPINTAFVGRETYLLEIKEQLNKADNNTVCVIAETGLGGIGKTQLALQYAYLNAKNYQLIWWFNAEDPVAGYRTLSKALNIELPDDKKSNQDIREIVLKKVETQHPNFLFIFDNALEPEELLPWLPTKCGHVIATSQSRKWKDKVETFVIKVFSKEESLQLLNVKLRGSRCSLEENRENIEELVEELGHLPVALSQAAAYLKISGDMEGYLALFRSHRKILWQYEQPASEEDYKHTVQTTWALSMLKIKERETKLYSKANHDQPLPPTTDSFMAFCSLLMPDHISIDLAEKWISVATKCDDQNPLIGIWRNTILRNLHDFSLIEMDNTAFSVHRLVSLVARDGVSSETIATTIQVLDEMFDESKFEDPEHWDYYYSLLQHLKVLLPLVTQKEYLLSLSRLCRKANSFLYHKGDKDESESLLKRVKQQLTPFINDDNIKLESARLWTAFGHSEVENNFQENIARFNTAIQLLDQIKKDNAIVGEECKQTLMGIFNGIALVHKRFGDIKEAEKYTLKSIDLVTPKTNKHAVLLINLLDIESRMPKKEEGQLGKSMQHFTQASQIYQAAKNPQGEGWALGKWANALQHYGEYGEAEAFYMKADMLFQENITIRLQLWNALNWAVLYIRSNREIEAIGLLKSVVSKGLEAYGKKPNYVIKNACIYLGKLYIKLHQQKEINGLLGQLESEYGNRNRIVCELVKIDKENCTLDDAELLLKLI